FSDLYTHRNLWALGAIAAAGKDLNLGVRLVNLVGNNATRMRRHRDAGGGQMSGTYYIPQVNRESDVRDIILKKFRTVVDAVAASSRFHGDCAISTEPAQHLALESDSVDFIFTDPPYAGNIQYGELNFVCEAWLGFDGAWRKHEAIVKYASVDPEGIYTTAAWESRLREAFRRCYRALKPGRWMCVCYHDTAEGTWRRVQDSLVDIGFEIHS